MLEVVIRNKSFQSADGTVLNVINDLKFTVETGRLSCLVGPSGCGKTSTLRLIMGVDKAYDGQISKSVTGRMAAVFQESRLLPWRTVDSNVRLALSDDRADSDLSDLYKALGLTQVLHFYPGQLSGGLARRVALARAFAVEPSLLLLDEPFVSLDDAMASRLRRLLIDVWSHRPTTTLMVTHNVREAVELADEIIFLTPIPATVSRVFKITVPRDRRDDHTVTELLKEALQAHANLDIQTGQEGYANA